MLELEHSVANLLSGLEGLVDEKMIDILLFKSRSSVNKHNRSTSHSLKRRKVAGLRCSRGFRFVYVGCPGEITLTQRHSVRQPLLDTHTEKQRDRQTCPATQTEIENQIQ